MGYLCSSSSITDLVPKASIKMGWQKTIDSFPCIILTQIGEIDTGYTGYKTSAAGSRLRREEVIIGIDIYSRDSVYETYQIRDVIIPLLRMSGSCKNESDSDLYDDETSIYHKPLTFSVLKFVED